METTRALWKKKKKKNYDKNHFLCFIKSNSQLSTYIHFPDTLFRSKCKKLWVQLSMCAIGLRSTHYKKGKSTASPSKHWQCKQQWGRHFKRDCPGLPSGAVCGSFWTLPYLHISSYWTRIPIKSLKSNVNVRCWKRGLMDRRREEELDNYLRREKEEAEAEEADISCSHSSSGS